MTDRVVYVLMEQSKDNPVDISVYGVYDNIEIAKNDVLYLNYSYPDTKHYFVTSNIVG
jgi:hypothetical protein